MIKRVADFLFVLREVDFHLWFHIESDESDVILRLQIREECIGPIFREIGKLSVIASAKLHHNYHGDRSFGGAKVADRLRNTVFEQTKILTLQSADDVSMVGGGHDVHRDHGNFDSDREAA